MSGLRQFAAVAAIAMAGMGAAAGMQSQGLHVPAHISLWPDMSASAKTADVAKPQLVPAALLPAPAAKNPATPKAAQIPQPSFDPAVSEEQGEAVAERLRDQVPDELFSYFDVFLYVSKAADGAWAQHLYMFHKSRDGDLVFEQAFPVSTGRELREKYFTSTPTGLFELDPERFDRVHYSHVWHGAAMPWAMFLDYTIHGHLTGIALHSAEGHAFELGHRASGGCVRLPPEKAEELFNRFQREERGLVPVFAFDDERATTFTDGEMVRDADGNVVLQDGYKVLLFIEEYPGGPATVAVLS